MADTTTNLPPEAVILHFQQTHQQPAKPLPEVSHTYGAHLHYRKQTPKKKKDRLGRKTTRKPGRRAFLPVLWCLTLISIRKRVDTTGM